MTLPEKRPKGGNPDELVASENRLECALLSLYRLKRMFRKGWLASGVGEASCETVADHSFMTAISALLLAPVFAPGVDAGKVALIALAHELGEVFAGDITPHDGVPPEEKRLREGESVDRLLAGLPEASLIRSLWEEYEACETAEARFAKTLDRFEMGIQARVYEAEGMQGMGEFIAAARSAISGSALEGVNILSSGTD